MFKTDIFGKKDCMFDFQGVLQNPDQIVEKMRFLVLAGQLKQFILARLPLRTVVKSTTARERSKCTGNKPGPAQIGAISKAQK